MGGREVWTAIWTTHRPPVPQGASAQRANPQKPFEPSGETAAPHPRLFFDRRIFPCDLPQHDQGIPPTDATTSSRSQSPALAIFALHRQLFARGDFAFLAPRVRPFVGVILPNAPAAAILSLRPRDSIAASAESIAPAIAGAPPHQPIGLARSKQSYRAVTPHLSPTLSKFTMLPKQHGNFQVAGSASALRRGGVSFRCAVLSAFASSTGTSRSWLGTVNLAGAFPRRWC